VGRRSDRAGQQTRPPLSEHLWPRSLLELGLEEAQPVAEPCHVTEHLSPLVPRDRPAWRRSGLESPRVAIEPGVRGVRTVVPLEHLDHHRPVIGQVPLELRSVGEEPLVRLVEYVVTWRESHAPDPIASPAPRSTGRDVYLSELDATPTTNSSATSRSRSGTRTDPP
jgi:hypothetical protein